MVRRRTCIALVCAVMGLMLVTGSLAPHGGAATRCGVIRVTLAIEICPPGDVATILAAIGEDGHRRLARQTLADFVLIAAYAGLWAVTARALHPGLAAVVLAAAAADVVENLAILGALTNLGVVPLIRWAGLAKWVLLGVVFVAFPFLFWPDRVSRRRWLLGATALAYGITGVGLVVGVFRLSLIEHAFTPLAVAVALQLAIHVAAHDEFQALRRRRAARWQPPGGPLSVVQVLREEYERLHAQPAPGPLTELYEAIHRLDDKRAALCLSGGGIRSATFALGVMQGLAGVGALPRFHYLSTVSGGGYIGSWLTAWLHHRGNDVAGVADEMARLDETNKLHPEREPIVHLREYSNYLAPRAGLLSADTWTLIGTILRNLILLWVVVVPILAAVLMLPRVYLSLMLAGALGQEVRGIGGTALLVIGGAALAWAVAYIGASIPNSTTALRGQGPFLALCLVPLMVAVLCLTLYWSWWPTQTVMAFVWFAVGVHVLAWAGYTVWLLLPWGQARPSPGPLLKVVGGAAVELGVVVVVGSAAGALAAVLANWLFPDPHLGGVTLWYAAVAPAVFVGAFLLAASLLVGLLSRWTEDGDREWWARSGAWTLVAGLVWLVLNGLVLFGPVLFSGPVVTSLLGVVGGGSGLLSLIRGWSARTVAGGTSDHARRSPFDRLVLPAAAAVFLALLLITISTLTSALLGGVIGRDPGLDLPVVTRQWPEVPDGPFDHVGVVLRSLPALVALLGLGLALLGGAAAWLINTNKFSLHAMYRARLIRAYLGASNVGRHGHPFTGFDETDNIQMHELWPSPQAPAGAERRALFHVINLALNLVHGDQLAWQQRKAHSFTVSSLHAGSIAVGEAGGYRRTGLLPGDAHHYGGREGISLGTAMTISGAAASPNMGYHSSPLVTFLMTFFNARLGWWLGNPGSSGASTYYLPSPRVTVRPIVAEAFGLTDRTSPYVYLSDGGHFENLGLYEMVLRRCHVIVVSDATADATCALTALGGAIRKIRVDLGIPVEFPRGISISSRAADSAKRARGVYWAVGRIRYSEVDRVPDAQRDARDGWLLYVKPAFYGNEPSDVYEYAMANDEFPHESTVDQFFSESQFESYRQLGRHAVARLCASWTPGPAVDLVDLVRHADALSGPAHGFEG